MISKHLVEQNGITQAAEKEIIEFGITQGMSLISNLLIFLTIGVIFRKLPQGICFLMAFWPLRIYAGGYHADTRKRCFLLSMCIMIIIFFLLKYVALNRDVSLLLAIFMFSVVGKMAPVENENRVLDKTESYMFRRIVRWIQAVEGCVCLISYCVADMHILNAIVWAQCLMVLLLVTGDWKNRMRKIDEA